MKGKISKIASKTVYTILFTNKKPQYLARHAKVTIRRLNLFPSMLLVAASVPACLGSTIALATHKQPK